MDRDSEVEIRIAFSGTGFSLFAFDFPGPGNRQTGSVTIRDASKRPSIGHRASWNPGHPALPNCSILNRRVPNGFATVCLRPRRRHVWEVSNDARRNECTSRRTELPQDTNFDRTAASLEIPMPFRHQRTNSPRICGGKSYRSGAQQHPSIGRHRLPHADKPDAPPSFRLSLLPRRK